jgi:hypothetical protein
MREQAEVNLQALRENPYPGRGIVIGRDETGRQLIQVYWIMGRSANSRNRVFEKDDATGRLFTEAADLAKVEDPSLIFYNAMMEQRGIFIVSNGDQTDTIAQAIRAGSDSYEALSQRTYEPDKPNYTCRIAGLCFGGTVGQLAVLRRSAWGDTCDRHFYEFSQIAAGLGFCITTYAGDGNPLPPFRGEPYLLPLIGGIEEVAAAMWSALNEANRVSLAVKFINIDTGRSRISIINEYEKVR